MELSFMVIELVGSWLSWFDAVVVEAN
jgi:hypothetical protein